MEPIRKCEWATSAVSSSDCCERHKCVGGHGKWSVMGRSNVWDCEICGAVSADVETGETVHRVEVREWKVVNGLLVAWSE